jgi:predicted transcriptional regulator
VLAEAKLTCRPDATAGEVRRDLDGAVDSVCVVVNHRGVVVGRVRRKDLPEDDATPVTDFMRIGPATVQRGEELRGLVHRMRDAGVKTIIVTTPRGELLGLVHRDDAERFLADRE